MTDRFMAALTASRDFANLEGWLKTDWEAIRRRIKALQASVEKCRLEEGSQAE